MYAGFWKRFAAYLIDYVLLTVVIYLLALIIGAMAGGSESDGDGSGMAALASVFSGFFLLLFLLLPWLYYSLMESSGRQATLGKMALGIRVVDDKGGRIRFLRATGRFFAKILSGLLLTVGYLMAGFTPKKQALHDMVAGTLVVNANPEAEQ